jgi:hypothetical protein
MLATRTNDSIVITGKVNGITITQTYEGLSIWDAIKLFIKETASFAKH